VSHHFSGPDDPRVIAAVAGRKQSPGNSAEAARLAGMPKTSYSRALKFYDEHKTEKAERPILPVFPDEDIPATEILGHLGKRFNQRLTRDKALKWFDIKMKTDRPVGMAVVGDPHLGSNGCNVPLLQRDVELMATTPGVHAVNIGDTADNWSNRMVHLYAENDVSRQTERKLARWLLQDAGVPWMLWLMGNHDLFDGEFSTYLKTIGASQLPMLDWQAKFQLRFPNRRVCKVDAAHNHKGTSIYNPLHGQKRASLWSGGEHADIFVAGHHHVSAATQEETDDGRIVTLARARGYKYIDHWGTTHGFPNNQHGATILFVIDPEADSAVSFVQPFLDLRAGCEYLTYLRSR